MKMRLGKILSMMRPRSRGRKGGGLKSLFIIVRKDGKPVRYGVNGGGALGFCMYLGQIAAFMSHSMARSVVDTLDSPGDYEIVKYDAEEV